MGGLINHNLQIRELTRFNSEHQDQKQYMKRTLGQYPYEGYYVYGPYFHKKEGRFFLNLINSLTGVRNTVQVARYLYETYHKIKLSRNETIDHIDDNKLNDAIENLQILSRQANTIKSKRPRSMAVLTCSRCSIVFSRPKNQTYGRKAYFCSKACRKLSSNPNGPIA